MLEVTIDFVNVRRELFFFPFAFSSPPAGRMMILRLQQLNVDVIVIIIRIEIHMESFHSKVVAPIIVP